MYCENAKKKICFIIMALTQSEEIEYAKILEWMKDYKTAKAEARKTVLRKLALAEVMEEIPTYFKNKLDDYESKIKEQKENSDSKYFAFITINPEKNTMEDFYELNKITEKVLKKVWITQYGYCYEQRSDDPSNIFGLHLHMIIVRAGKRPSELEREFRSSFRKLVGIPSLHINIQWKKKDWFQDKIDYMRGLKYGEDKDVKCEVDKVMRQQLEIEDYYGNIF